MFKEDFQNLIKKYSPDYNYAFIDAQNLYLSIKNIGWGLDYKKLRIYLKEKYRVEKAFMFIGYIKKNERLYQRLKQAGYILIFKKAVKKRDGTIKGNVDAELVVEAAGRRFFEYKKAILITGDGDFACLIEYLKGWKKFGRLLVPNQKKYSSLLKESAFGQIDYISLKKNKLMAREIKNAPRGKFYSGDKP